MSTFYMCWLKDAGGKQGIFYPALKVLSGILIAFFGGLGSTAEPSSARAHTSVVFIILLEASTGFYCLCFAQVADRLEGRVSGVVSLALSLSIALQYAGASAIQERNVRSPENRTRGLSHP